MPESVASPPVRLRYLHRAVIRSRPHPRHARTGASPDAGPAAKPPSALTGSGSPAASGTRKPTQPRPAAVPRLLRLQRRGRLERPRLRTVAPHRHHPPPPARQDRPNPRRPRPAVLRQSRRVPGRGLVHFHAIFRLDGTTTVHPERTTQPHPALTAGLLAGLIRQVAPAVWFATVPHPARP